VLLWFGSWKNGASNYVPLWVKQDRTHFPTMIDASGNWTGVISPYFHSTLEADSKAFAALMDHLKQMDGDRHTVIMVQVENETGSFGTPRDYSAEANRLFDSAVPEKLVTALGKKTGTWQQLFGAQAEEAFAAWGFSTYVGEVAAAGKKTYPLPMYVNCWLAEGADFQRPGENYPSGGPEPAMLDVWKSMAPALDIIGPDIYLSSRQQYREDMTAYRRPDNAMFIPETSYDGPSAQRLFEAVGEFGTIGFSPFGLDATGWTNTAPAVLTDLAESYRLLAPMTAELSRWQAAGKLHSVVQDYRKDFELLHLEQYDVLVQFGRPNWGFGSGDAQGTGGRVLIAEVGPSEFVLTGFHARVSFRARRGLPAPGQRKPGDGGRFFLVEEGGYQDGQWKVYRELNGDQTDFGVELAQEWRGVSRCARAVLTTAFLVGSHAIRRGSQGSRMANGSRVHDSDRQSWQLDGYLARNEAHQSRMVRSQWACRECEWRRAYTHHAESVLGESRLQLPSVPGRIWLNAVDTSQPPSLDAADFGGELPVVGNAYRAQGRSVVVLINRNRPFSALSVKAHWRCHR
jgi:Domain of unknown function (DUF5597)